MIRTEIQCPSCQSRYRFASIVLPIHCSCGFKITDLASATVNGYYLPSAPAKKQDDLPCMYRGKSLREINCGCSGKPKIYECSKHGEAYLRKLPKMTKEMVAGCTMCLDCDDRKRYERGTIGVAAEVHNRIGGTETYWSLLHSTLGIAGVASRQQPEDCQTPYPVFGGAEAIEELASQVDYLVVWGVSEAAEVTKGPVRIAMHHGSLHSSWANRIFEDQLKWCEMAVAVNEQVAKHYGVSWIGNVVDPARLNRETYPIAKPAGKKIVFWCHRDAQEKRPHLVRRIASALPDGWLVVATLPQKYETKNLRCIGRIDNPAAWLEVADVFLSTADQEAFGYSVAEALLCNVPVVSSPHGIAADPQLVWQVDTEDPQAWVDAIILADSCRTMKQPAIEDWKQTMDIDRFRKQWKSLLSLPFSCSTE